MPNLAVKLTFDLLLHEHDFMQKVLDKAAREMGEAEDGQRVRPKDALLHLAREFLEPANKETAADASEAVYDTGSGGRLRRRESCYTVLYHRCLDCRRAHSMTSEGPVEVPQEVVDSVEGKAKKITIRPEEEERPDNGPEEAEETRNRTVPKPVPMSERDCPNSEAIVQKVSARDGFICRNPYCRRREVQGHHIFFRIYGGRTALWNEVALCPRCHALVHADRLKVEGDPIGGLKWTPVSEDIPLEVKEDSIRPVLGLEAPCGSEGVSAGSTQSGIPDSRRIQAALDGGEVSLEWWRKNRRYFEWSERRRVWSFQPLSEIEESEESEAEEEATSRPPGEPRKILENFIGQSKVVKSLSVAIEASKISREVPPPILLSGPPGLGKTTLARGIAEALESGIQQTVGPRLSDLGALVGILSELRRGDVLFIDEIHRLAAPLAECPTVLSMMRPFHSISRWARGPPRSSSGSSPLS